MVGLKFLLCISTVLCLAKEDQGAFGGINIVFAGDFVQLPPVCDSRLFSWIDKISSSDAALKHMQGKLLWFAVDTAVVLDEVMRQEGAENQSFVELLGRLRTGKWETVRLNWDDAEWRHTPLIVTENVVKDAFNDQVACVFAEHTGHPLHYYYSVDKHRNTIICDGLLHNHLANLTSGVTSQ
ncbi:hypothetical protein ARMGADRAFT_927757 [Armillaria gallica]|uniref:ATP-dependent DNA helicase n=1 Tax=Armillaria gallica TaxID=47427 RepID=A0A2H3E1N3_ARMGA|nr:hypothetical protein ARMGADRAFT_927757 [Armillaria gallica]